MSDTLTIASVQLRKNRRPATQALIASPSVLAGVATATLALVVYVATMAPDLYSLDSPELAAAAYRLGIAHPPGYPLYTLVGWLFSHAFPIGNVAFRMNLLSALFGTAACALVYALALRLTTRPLVAAAGTLALAFSYYFWADALAAEVYTLDAALFAGTLLAAYAWREQPSLRRAAIVGVVLGLGLATRTTTLLYVPAVALFVWTAGERSPRAYAAASAGLLSMLLLYAYLPIRSAIGVDVGPGTYGNDGVLHVWNLASVGGFWRHISASAFQSEAFAYGPIGMLRESGTFAGRLAGSFLFVGIPFGIAGIVRQWRSDRGLLLLIAGTAAPVTLFFINYGALDKEFMFLPAYVAWAFWLVVGVDWAIEASAPDAGWLVGAAALALPVAAFAVNLPLVSLHNERGVRDDSERFLAAAPQGAIVYGSFLDLAPLQYLQEVEGARPDLRLVNSWTVDDAFLLRLAATNVGETPLYITRDEPVLHAHYQIVPVANGAKGFEVRVAKKG